MITSSGRNGRILGLYYYVPPGATVTVAYFIVNRQQLIINTIIGSIIIEQLQKLPPTPKQFQNENFAPFSDHWRIHPFINSTLLMSDTH